MWYNKGASSTKTFYGCSASGMSLGLGPRYPGVRFTHIRNNNFMVFVAEWSNAPTCGVGIQTSLVQIQSDTRFYASLVLAAQHNCLPSNRDRFESGMVLLISSQVGRSGYKKKSVQVYSSVVLMVSMTVSKSVGRDSSSLATEVINFYVNIKLLCRSSSEAERRIANSEVVISKFIYGSKNCCRKWFP